jgi:hypothetical protein
MFKPERPDPAYLRGLLDGKRVIATAVRERRTTPRGSVVVSPLRWWFMVVLAACTPAATKPDTYARGTNALESCCEQLHGPGRDRCLADLPRVDDQGARVTATNQQTYACIVDHFTCDGQTGKATQASAQAQYDCIEDLQ